MMLRNINDGLSLCQYRQNVNFMKRAVTLSDVARESSVSRSAAARVLLGTGGKHVRVAPATQKRIELAAQRLNYVPNRTAQQLRGAPSKTIGVILDTLNTPVMSQRLFALEREVCRLGYRVLIGQTHNDPQTLQDYASDFIGRSVEAILCLFDLVPDRDQRIRKCFGDFRKVVFHGRPPWPGGYSICVDAASAIHDCLRHLDKQDKKAPALALWNDAEDELMQTRKLAFKNHLAKQGARGLVWDARSKNIDPTPQIVEQGISFMVHQHKADAILASNDIWATRFIQQLQRQGIRVPQDVAVIGYDDLDIASVISPSLTTINQCHGEYAKNALELLLALASGRRIPLKERSRTIAPRLVIREST